jgi:hypothetical protein
MKCEDCLYKGLTGIIIDEAPDLDFIKNLDENDISHVVKTFAKYKYKHEPSGITTTFWGHTLEYLSESLIVDIKNKKSYKPRFNLREGIYMPDKKITLCSLDITTKEQKENILKNRAMKELLTQTSSYMNGFKREGNYFMITPFNKGCCGFGSGKISIELGHLKEVLNEYRTNYLL